MLLFHCLNRKSPAVPQIVASGANCRWTGKVSSLAEGVGVAVEVTQLLGQVWASSLQGVRDWPLQVMAAAPHSAKSDACWSQRLSTVLHSSPLRPLGLIDTKGWAVAPKSSLELIILWNDVSQPCVAGRKVRSLVF